MSVPYHEILKAPYNIRKVKQEHLKPKQLSIDNMRRLEELALNQNFDTFLKNQEKQQIKRI
jgi:hypothetical protein